MHGVNGNISRSYGSASDSDCMLTTAWWSRHRPSDCLLRGVRHPRLIMLAGYNLSLAAGCFRSIASMLCAHRHLRCFGVNAKRIMSPDSSYWFGGIALFRNQALSIRRDGSEPVNGTMEPPV